MTNLVKVLQRAKRLCFKKFFEVKNHSSVHHRYKSPEIYRLHSLDIVIANICHRVGDFPGGESRLQIAHRFFQRMMRLKTKFAENLFRGYMIGTMIVGRYAFNRYL